MLFGSATRSEFAMRAVYGIWYRTKHQVLSHPYNNLVAFSPAWHLRKHNLCMHLSASSQFLQSSLPTGASNPNTPLLSSLVQTLSSIASTTTSPSTPVPKSSMLSQANNNGGGGGGGLSAAAAASLFNTLILAQNVLTSNYYAN